MKSFGEKPSNSGKLPEGSEEAIRAEMASLLDDVPFRIPIVKDKDEARDGKADGQWRAITEAARRGILADPEMRRAGAELASEPLSEKLPAVAVEKLAAVDQRVARLAALGKAARELLAYDPIPDELLEPDIRNAPYLQSKEFYVDYLTLNKTYDEAFDPKRAKAEVVDAAVKQPGISEAEKMLVARRYRYARDAKLLGLIAELHDQAEVEAANKNGLISFELPSGTKLTMTSDAYEMEPSLLDPKAWEGRRQLKDRVYLVTIDGREYIMKERKTPRHTDVKSHGHVDGATSEQEFATAQEFANLGVIRRGDIQLRWERPLGYVEFSDGYQFCIFEAETDLADHVPVNELIDEILKAPEQYTDAFASVSQRAKQIYQDREDLLKFYNPGASKSKLRRILGRAGLRRSSSENQPRPDELTFEEFAALEAYYMVDDARELLANTMLDNGYVNSDFDGYAFRLHKGNRPSLEIIGFDFEYYSKDQQRTEEIKLRMQEGNNAELRARIKVRSRDRNTRAIAGAAAYAMIEQRGYALPGKR